MPNALTRALWAICLLGWAWYTVDNAIRGYTAIQAYASTLNTYTAQHMPDQYTALVSDIISEPFPPMIARKSGYAADALDQYIVIGDDFYSVATSIQRFILAHEMCHYREMHNIIDITASGVYIPALLLICIVICMWIALQLRWRRDLEHLWHRYAATIDARTLSLHAPGVRHGIYVACYVLCVAGGAYIMSNACEAAHDYIRAGLTQYTEYRADMQAVCQTHDADAPRQLFDDDTEHDITDTHPPDQQRRAYITSCQMNGFMPHTWPQAWHLLTPQQRVGMGVYHLAEALPARNVFLWVNGHYNG